MFCLTQTYKYVDQSHRVTSSLTVELLLKKRMPLCCSTHMHNRMLIQKHKTNSPLTRSSVRKPSGGRPDERMGLAVPHHVGHTTWDAKVNIETAQQTKYRKHVNWDDTHEYWGKIVWESVKKVKQEIRRSSSKKITSTQTERYHFRLI